MSIGRHYFSGENSPLSRCLRYMAVAVAVTTLGGSALGADAQTDSCDRLQMIVWGIISPGSTFGLIKNLEAVPGVDHVRFDLRHAVATVDIHHGATVSDNQLRAAVISASYTPREINRPSACPSGSDE